ncbi:MBL fold metallo-hydrolase [Fulvivirga lutea]|uniref:MBL fold metallo-hydrolase n=1 Tax=Fulvivirga lutea TaxID=2810512 RepID=A0A974WGL5_9BACT|nr:MBL fold metallo-hydrolase [Fulvivirga lutea]QSE97936.1 MBL fold metallo-hydrolase [Fulvivirga lutea]
MIQVQSFTFNPFLENTYVLYDETKEAIVIDPGCYENYEKEQLNSFIEEQNLNVKRLINTHCHIDHVFGNEYVKNKYGVKLEVHEADVATLRAVKAYAPSYGFQHFEESEVDLSLKEGDIVKFGNSELDVLFVPGHAPGHIALHSKADNICINGDVLFRESIGRTDLPGGDFDTLIKSIHDKLFALPDETVVYCGHGPETTIGHEKQYNPFCALRN